MDASDLGKRPSPTAANFPDHTPVKQVRCLSERPSPFSVKDVTTKMMDGAAIPADDTPNEIVNGPGDDTTPQVINNGFNQPINETESTDFDSDCEAYPSDQEGSDVSQHDDDEKFQLQLSQHAKHNSPTPSPIPDDTDAEIDRLIREGLDDDNHQPVDMLLNFANSADAADGAALPELRVQDISQLIPVEAALRPPQNFEKHIVHHPTPPRNRMFDDRRIQITRQRAANRQLFSSDQPPYVDTDLDSDPEDDDHDGLCYHIPLTLSIRHLSLHTDQLKGPSIIAYNGEWNIMAQFTDGLLGCFVQYTSLVDDPRNGSYLCDVDIWCKNDNNEVVQKKPLYHCFTGNDDFGFRNYINDLTPIVGSDEFGRYLKIRAKVTVLCRKPAGFRNSHVFCYMNSALQSLFSLPKFNRIILQVDKKHKCIDALKSVMLQHHQSSKHAVSPNSVYEHSKWNEDHHQFLQQDAQEFLRYFIDELENILSDTPQGPQITDLFRGETSEYVNCLDVDYKSDKRDFFYDIQVNMIGPDGDLVTNFDDALKNYLTPTLLQGDNMYNCDGHGKQRAEKGVKFVKFPPVLNVYIMRYKYTDTGVEKISDRFEFPRTVDLSIYIDTELATEDDYRYELHTVLVHRGGGSGGHYYAYINKEFNGSDHWVRFDDTNVTSCSPEAVYGDEDFTPYMLVYIKTSLKHDMLRPLSLREHNMPVDFHNVFYDYVDKLAFVTDKLIKTAGNLDLCTSRTDLFFPLHTADPFDVTAADVYDRAAALYHLEPNSFRLWVYGVYSLKTIYRTSGNRRPIELLHRDSNIPLARHSIFQRRYTFYIDHITPETEEIFDDDVIVFLKKSNASGIQYICSLIWKAEVSFKDLVKRMKEIAEMPECEVVYADIDLSRNKPIHISGPLDTYDKVYRTNGSVFILEDKNVPNMTCDTLERLAMTVRILAVQDNRFHIFGAPTPHITFELDCLLTEKVHHLRAKVAEKVGVDITRVAVLRADDKELLRDYVSMEQVFKIKDHDPRLGRVYEIHFCVLINDINHFKDHFILEVHSGLFRNVPHFTVNAFVDPDWTVANVLHQFRQRYSLSEDVGLMRFNRTSACFDFIYRNHVKLRKLKSFAKDHTYQLMLELMPMSSTHAEFPTMVTVVVKMLDYGMGSRFLRFPPEENGHRVRCIIAEQYRIPRLHLHRFEMRLMAHDGSHPVQSVTNDGPVDFANFIEEHDGGLQRIDVWCAIDNQDLPELGMSPMFSAEEDEDSS